MTVQTYLTNLCQHCGLDAEQVEIVIDDQEEKLSVLINVPEEDSGLLIGFHGETLSAMQRLTRVVFQEELGEKRLVININNYREQREEKVQDLARRAARKVLESGRPYTFSFLPANERFIVHTTLSQEPEFESVESISEGEGRDRILSIRLKEVAE